MTIARVERLEGRQLLASMVEYTIPSDTPRPTDITSGPDGNLWFAETNTNQIGRITPAGTITEYSLPAGSNPDYITKGPDKNLWFTEPGTDSIGEITTTGVITQYPVTEGSELGLAGIAPGPDGNLWFTEQNTDTIGEISTTGTFTYHTIAAIDSAYEITEGPDGNMWFTEINADKVGEYVTTGPDAGNLNLYTLSSEAGPRGITVGPDGNLWFTEGGLDQIGRITTAGTVAEFSIPTIDSGPAEISTGPGGDLYFAETNTNNIGQITTSGVVTNEFPITTSNSDPDGMTLGPDGKLWFTEFLGDQVANLSVSSPTILAVSQVSATYGGSATIQASLTSDGSPVSGELVDLRLGDDDLGDVMTNAQGVASITGLPIGPIHAGTYVGDVTASFGGDANYDPSSGSNDVTVTPASLTIAANGQTMVYGSTVPNLTATYTGFVDGDTSSSLTTPPQITTTASSTSDVGSYAITVNGGSDPDYVITRVDGQLTVTPAPLTVSVDDATKVYGQANPTPFSHVSGVVNGDDVSASYAAQAGQYSDVNPSGYPITFQGLAGAKAADYSATIEGAAIFSGTLYVTPAPLTIAIDDQSKVYGEDDPAPIGTVVGILNGDDVSAVYTDAAGPSSDVQAGGYAISLASLAGSKSEDYSTTVAGGSVGDGTLTITRAPLTITADAAAKVYGQANPDFFATYAGFVLDQDPSNLGGTLAFTTAATASSDVGSYPVTPGGLTSSDYAIAYDPGQLSVTPASLTVTVDDQAKTYGQANPTFTASYSGFVLDQGPSDLGGSLAFSTPATQASHFGIYPVSAGGLIAPQGDYAITYVGGGIAITPASLTVTPASFFKGYGQAVPSLTATYTGFVNGDTPASLLTPVSLGTPETSASHVGFYPVVASGATSMDYLITEDYGISAVVPAALIATPNGGFVAYGQAVPNFGITYTGFVNGDTAASLTSPPTLFTPATAGSLPGYYPIVAIGGSARDYVVVDNLGFADVLTPPPASLGADPGLAAFVASVYEDLLGRAPEPGGLGFWVSQLEQGVSQSSVVEQIDGSAEAVSYRATRPNQQASLAVAYYDAVISEERVDGD